MYVIFLDRLGPRRTEYGLSRSSRASLLAAHVDLRFRSGSDWNHLLSVLMQK